MAIDASIYNILNPQGLQQGLAGIGEAYSRGQEQTARLASLAQQKELQDMQLAQMKQQSALYPQQLAEAQRKRETEYMQNVSREIAQAPENAENILSKHATLAPQYGINPENITWLASDLMTAPDITKLQQRALYHANPAEFEKGMIKSQFEQPKGTPSQVATMIKEYEAATGQKMPMEEQARLYKQGLETKTSPQQSIQIVSGENNQQYAVTAPKTAGSKPVITGLGIVKPSKESQLSPQAQKELFEADENIQTASSVTDTLNQALALNKNSYSGYGALLRAKAASNLPGQTDEKATNTILMDNLIREQALSSMKMIFGGNPTEGERAILVELQASAEKTPEQRDAILKRAMTLANNKLKFNQKKAESLRGGTYFKESPIANKEPEAQAQGNTVTLPNGQTKTFPSAAAAQAFKKAAGIKD